MTRVPLVYYALLLVALLVANVQVYRDILTPAVLKIQVFEVGRADRPGRAVLLRTIENKMVLINTGPDASILRALGTALPPWRRHIDAVILTSSKTAYAGGLTDVETRYKVSRALSSNTHYSLGPDISLEILSPDSFTLSYGSAVFSVSSSTPPGLYIYNGQTVMKTK